MSNQNNSVELNKIIKEYNLEILNRPDNLDTVMVTRSDIHRPGLALTGYFEYFDNERVQIIGKAESIYLSQLTPEDRLHKVDAFCEKHPICIVIARNMDPCPEMLEMTRKYSIPLLRTSMTTSNFASALITSLSVYLAPKITRHGVLVEVYGEGILILGDSGIGKSETAIELIKRGHRLIADDAVEIKRVSEKTLVGQAPDTIRYYMELRGIGIIDVRRIFGMGAVKETEKIELVIKFEPWVEGKMYDRLGLESEFFEILGIKIPSITVPVRPGRNLAAILEIAAMNSRLKKMGYNTAEEFNKKLEENMFKNSK